VAKMTDEEVKLQVREASVEDLSLEYVHNQLKLAMLAFNEVQFNQVIDQLEDQMSFREIFQNVFVSFLESVGTWWMTDVIRPAHEHFVSNLVRQKLFAQIDKTVRLGTIDESEVYVLFTPTNEIHDLGLLYVHYELLLRAKRSIFLGQSVPINDLTLVEKGKASHHYICATTIRPETEHVGYYIYELHQKLLSRKNDHLVLFGAKVREKKSLPELSNTQYFDSMADFLEQL
jgi:methanogenic corrinoid protein MtbC1